MICFNGLNFNYTTITTPYHCQLDLDIFYHLNEREYGGNHKCRDSVRFIFEDDTYHIDIIQIDKKKEIIKSGHCKTTIL